ncbi:hypothetical protein GCM10017673_04770 [Streptosporangium violaceochromogenes]|nr:hypothetical protein GCM10017673_04770 [Streptosporangium violaceochromogenes]
MPVRKHAASATGKRVPALDGIRAFAVVAVLLYHLEIGRLPGGFLGVDVFFVLSGFLIGGLLLAELRSTGRVDLVAFWLRRGRRLLPALLLLLAVLTCYTATRPPQARLPLREDILSALAYVANWHFVIEGRSYFAEFQPASPMRHLWSLAIEEQFYLVLPLLLLGLCLLAPRLRRPAGASLLAAGIVASVLVQALTYREADPSRAYYGTDARLHELLVGVALAWLYRRAAGRADGRLGERLRPAAPYLAGAGLLALLAMIATVDDRAPFYYRGGSLLVSAATGLLVAGVAAAPRRGVVARALSTPAVAGLGRISYGLYLWHWPVIAIVTAESVPLSGATLVAVQVLSCLAVSVASYLLVERPVRRGAVGPFRLTPGRFFPAALASVLLIACATAAASWGAPPEPEYVRQRDGLTVDHDADPARPVIGLIGDSIAVSLQSALSQEASRRGLTLVSAARPGCGAGSSLLLDETGHPFAIAPVCAERTPRLQEQLVARFRPRLVIWHSARDRTDIRVGSRVVKAGTAEWLGRRLADWDATLDRLSRTGARVAVVLPAWSARASKRTGCGGEFNFDPPSCGLATISTEHLRRLYRRWAASHPGRVTLVDLAELACPGGIPCPERLSGVRLRDDDVHFSPEGARLLAPSLLDRILGPAAAARLPAGPGLPLRRSLRPTAGAGPPSPDALQSPMARTDARCLPAGGESGSRCESGTGPPR